jgi:hypothetical protein
MRGKEHEKHTHLYKPDKSAVAEHNFTVDHCISFKDATVSASMAYYTGHVFKEAVEI